MKDAKLSAATTLSGIPVKPLYTEKDLSGLDYERDLGYPGEYPYTRGVYPTMHRGRLWTMRQFAGFGSAEDTNRRFRFLIEQGNLGLSTAFDMPTLMGYDSDHECSRGEVGREGVAVDSLADMEALFKGIPLDRVTTSMTINGPAAVLFAMYVLVAEKQGAPKEKLGGTVQTDILKEFIAQKEWICPPEPSMRIITDMIEYSAAQLPRWNPISISGYHIREAGSTAVQELAFTLADGIAYVEAALERGLDVDSFAPRLSFFFNAHNDFFEEIAKYRAARRIWAKVMRERFHAKDPRSGMLRMHVQTSGASLAAKQPYNNIVRVTIQALGAVLGGTQSLHTNSMDETLSLPTEEAVTIALRTQQIIAEESGVTSTIDPCGGSYFVEALTNRMEEEAMAYIRKIDELGGMIRAIEVGYPMREIQEAAFRFQKQLESGERAMIGVNRFELEEEPPIPTFVIDPNVEADQNRRLKELRASRDAEGVRAALEGLRVAGKAETNLMPPIMEAVGAYATLGEICDVFRKTFGVYREQPIF